MAVWPLRPIHLPLCSKLPTQEQKRRQERERELALEQKRGHEREATGTRAKGAEGGKPRKRVLKGDGAAGKREGKGKEGDGREYKRRCVGDTAPFYRDFS